MVKFLDIVGTTTGTDLYDFIPSPKGTTSLKCWLRTETDNQFYPANKEGCLASQKEINQLLGCCITKCLNKVMLNHYYTVGGQVYNQNDGSPMGLDTSVEGSDLYMLAWELAFICKLFELGWSLEMYKR